MSTFKPSATPALSAMGTYSGKHIVSSPPIVYINFYSQSKDWEYLECHDVNILADGKRISIIKTTHDGHVGEGYVLEYVDSIISWDEVKKLSSAKNVEVQICNTEFVLSPKDMANLKELVRLLTPKPVQEKGKGTEKAKR
jgi:hypothetical protein